MALSARSLSARIPASASARNVAATLGFSFIAPPVVGAIRASLGVVTTNCRGDAIEVGEEPPLVHADEIELVAQARDLSPGKDELRDRVREVVRREERVERRPFVRAQRE